MTVFLNGDFVPEEEALVSVFDRSFLYGDGLFETLRIARGKPVCWKQHLLRLQAGAEFLGLCLPFDTASLEQAVAQLIEQNRTPEATLRITLSRGVGPRGYSPKGADKPLLVMSLHPAPSADPTCPPRWRLHIASVRLPVGEPLAEFKTCNKLPQILARAEAEANGADEALLLNTNGEVVEGASSNLFWIKDNVVCTAPLACGILAGVTRTVVFKLCKTLGVATEEKTILPKAIFRTDGIFLSLSTLGIVEAVSIGGTSIPQSPLTSRIREAYEDYVRRET